LLQERQDGIISETLFLSVLHVTGANAIAEDWREEYLLLEIFECLRPRRDQVLAIGWKKKKKSCAGDLMT
jgi:hypothetical protein